MSHWTAAGRGSALPTTTCHASSSMGGKRASSGGPCTRAVSRGLQKRTSVPAGVQTTATCAK
eukprot:15448128-Alexandrium_andersonii.AAC.1